MQIWCLKCKKCTLKKNPDVLLTFNDTKRLSTHCAVCYIKKTNW